MNEFRFQFSGKAVQPILAAAVLCCISLASIRADAGAIFFETSFQTSSQSIWGEGDAFNLDFNIPIVNNIGWGSRSSPLNASIGNVMDISTPASTIPNPAYTTWRAKKSLHNKFPRRFNDPGPAPVKTITTPATTFGKYGIETNATTSGRFGLNIEANISGGEVAVNLPLSVTFSFNEADVVPGQSFLLDTDFVIASDAQLSTISPNASTGLLLDADLQASIEADVFLGAIQGANTPLMLPIDVEGEFEVLGLSDDGLTFFGTLAEDVPEKLIDKGVSFAAKKVISKPFNAEITAANKIIKDIDAMSKEEDKKIRELEKDKKKEMRERDRLNERIVENNKAQADYDSQIAANNARKDEIDATDKSQLSDKETNALATEKSGLESQNSRLESRKNSLANQKTSDTNARDESNKSIAENEKKITESRVVKRSLDENKQKKKDEITETKKQKKAKKKQFNVVSKLVKGVIEADISLPVVETESGNVPLTGPLTLTSSGEDQFIELLVGIDDAMVVAAKLGITAASAGAGSFVWAIPPLSSEIELTDFLRAEYSILDLNVGARGLATQNFDFAPEFEVVLDVGDGKPLVFDLGDSVEITLPFGSDELVLNPTIRIKNQFTNTTGFRIQPLAELAVLGYAAGVTPPSAISNLVDPFTLTGPLQNPPRPLIGSIDGLDLIPEEYTLDTDLLAFDVFNKTFELGGFNDAKPGSITINAPITELLPGGAFESLENWNSIGNVKLDQGTARLETASAVSLLTFIDTPLDPFLLQFDYRFEDILDGFLRVYLDDYFLEAIKAFESPDFWTHSVFVNNTSLLGLSGVQLEFEYLDATGSLLYLDNVRTSGLATSNVVVASTVPEPPALILFVISLFGLGLQRRRLAAKKLSSCQNLSLVVLQTRGNLSALRGPFSSAQLYAAGFHRLPKVRPTGVGVLAGLACKMSLQ